MEQALTIDTLNRLLTVLHRSLPMYVTEANPWTHPGDEAATAVVRDIVTGQEEMAARLASLVQERGGYPDQGKFPMAFTDMNMLSLTFLLGEIANYLRRDIHVIQQCVEGLKEDAQAHELAEEVLGSQRAHLDAIQQCTQQPAAST